MCEFLFCFMANQHFLVTNQIAAKCWDRGKAKLFVPCISKTQSHLLRRSRRPQTVRRIKPRPSERWPGQHKIEKVDTSKKRQRKRAETRWETSWSIPLRRQDGRKAGRQDWKQAGRQAQEGGHSIPDQLGDKMKLGDKTWLYLVAEISLLTSGVSCWTVGLLLRVFPLVDACLVHILGIMFEIAASFYVQTQVPSSHCKPHHVLMQQGFLLLYTSPCSPAPAR